MSSVTRSTPATQGYFLMSQLTDLNVPDDLSYSVFTLSDTTLSPFDASQVFILDVSCDISADLSNGVSYVLKDYGQTVYSALTSESANRVDLRMVAFVDKNVNSSSAGIYIPLGTLDKHFGTSAPTPGLKSSAALIGSL